MTLLTHKVFYQHSKVDTQTYPDPETHRHAEKTCRHKHTHRHTYIYADKCTQYLTNTQTHRETNMYRQAHTEHTHNHGYTDQFTQRLTDAQLCETHRNRHTWRHIKIYKKTHTD